MAVRAELDLPVERIDRTHPPLGSRVDSSLLTGPQRIEAQAADLVAAQILQLRMNDPDFTRLNRTLGETVSLADLENRVSSSHSPKIIVEAKDAISNRLRSPNANNQVEFSVREALLQWADQGRRLRRPKNAVEATESSESRPKKAIRRGIGRYSGQRKEEKIKTS